MVRSLRALVLHMTIIVTNYSPRNAIFCVSNVHNIVYLKMILNFGGSSAVLAVNVYQIASFPISGKLASFPTTQASRYTKHSLLGNTYYSSGVHRLYGASIEPVYET